MEIQINLKPQISFHFEKIFEALYFSFINIGVEPNDVNQTNLRKFNMSK